MVPTPSSKFQYPTKPFSLPTGEQSILSCISCWLRAVFQISTLSNIPLKGPIHPVHPPVKISPISKGIDPTTLNKLIAEEPVDTPSI